MFVFALRSSAPDAQHESAQADEEQPERGCPPCASCPVLTREVALLKQKLNEVTEGKMNRFLDCLHVKKCDELRHDSLVKEIDYDCINF